MEASRVKQVPLLDLKRFDADYEKEVLETFERVFRSGYFILGPEVQALEEECAGYVGASHGVGVSSGTDALLIALMALGVGPGDEVICPTYTFFATAGSIWRSGARPVFVDNEPDGSTHNCDPEDVARKITDRTKAIIPVHLFGQCAEMGPILEVAGKRGIPVVEDAAQAIGSRYGEKGAGAIGSMGCFSFFPSKNLGAMGDGGLVTTDDDELADRLRVLRVHGSRPKYHHHVVGGNFRLDALQAALIRVKLRRLDAATEGRQRNADLYRRLLTGSGVAVADDSAESGQRPVSLPVERQTRHIYNQFVIRVHGAGQRDRLREHLKDNGVGTEVYYPVPMHLQQCFHELGHGEGDFPVAEAASRETLALPIFPELTEDEISYVADQIASFFS